jgi:hypothetical protein
MSRLWHPAAGAFGARVRPACVSDARCACRGRYSGVARALAVRGLADGGEHPEVVGGSGEEELAGGVVQAADAEAAQDGVGDEPVRAGSLEVGAAVVVGVFAQRQVARFPRLHDAVS